MALADYIHEKPTIETARLVIRPLRPDDAEDLRKWLTDDSIYTYWGKGPGKCDRNPELMFAKEKRPVKSFHLGIALKEHDEVIGEIWVYGIENDRMARTAIRLSSRYHGLGYGTEALSAMVRFCFEKTGLRRLFAEVDVRNLPSMRIFEKCGFTREGLIREGKMVNTWCDYCIYGILDSDLKNKKDS